MANIPIPENDDSLELNVRYQPDMVLEGMLDATVPEMKYLRLSQGNETHDLLGAQSGDQIMDMLAADVEASDNGKVLTAVYGGLEGEETGSVMWASPLPFIGEGDAGKVLTVNAGETWAEWAEPSGGVYPIIYLTRSQDEVTGDPVLHADVTLEELTSILDSSTFVFIGVHPDAPLPADATSTYTLCPVINYQGVKYCSVSGVFVMGSSGSAVNAIICYGQLGIMNSQLFEQYTVVDYDFTPTT